MKISLRISAGSFPQRGDCVWKLEGRRSLEQGLGIVGGSVGDLVIGMVRMEAIELCDRDPWFCKG